MEGSTLIHTTHAIEYNPTVEKVFPHFMIRMIVACARNRVMGAGGTLPWKIQADWDYFLETTRDDVLLMGRRCYEDFTEHAAFRKVVVLSRDPEIQFIHGEKAGNLADGLVLAQSMGKNTWICGGENIYREAMPLAEELYLTRIDQDYTGDTLFPPWEEFFTKEISRKEMITEGKRLTFLILGK